MGNACLHNRQDAGNEVRREEWKKEREEGTERKKNKVKRRENTEEESFEQSFQVNIERFHNLSNVHFSFFCAYTLYRFCLAKHCAQLGKANW